MAELDYAYLADFVSLQDGKLTAVGASFTFAAVPSVPSQLSIGIGGRVRGHVSEQHVPIEVTATPPDEAYSMTFNGDLQPGPNPRPYGDGMVGLLFAINFQIPVSAVGLYSFDISVAGVQARRLAFEVELPDEQ